MPNPQGYATGHVRYPNKDQLMKASARRHKQVYNGLVNANPPAAFDSRAMGWVGPIKNQGQCGSCWDFSGTGVVEIAYCKAGALKPDGNEALSEQYTLDCGRNGGCNGDDNVTVLTWAKQTGLPLTSQYGPYQGRASKCSFTNTETLHLVNDWGFVDGNQGQGVTKTDLIKAAIMQYGCVGCGVDAGFQDPGTGVISGGGNNIDHDVILVGWDDSKGKGAWIMRNSWGTSWAAGGYAWIEYGSYAIGTEAVWAYVTPIAPPIWFP